MIFSKKVGALCRDLLGAICCDLLGAISSGQVGALYAEFPNYIGQTMKNLRTFMNWILAEKGWSVGLFHKQFYIKHEHSSIVVLTCKQLQFLIFDKEFDRSLSKSLKRTKDLFVFGCTVALRFGDLNNLKKSNFVIREGKSYLVTSSSKTHSLVHCLLPQYAVDIIKSQKIGNNRLFKSISLFWFNRNVKKICEQAGWTFQINIKGVNTSKNKPIGTLRSVRFCDRISSHTMRRTAITTLLTLGINELLVKKISGHSDTSKSFYRYVQFNQKFADEQQIDAHRKLELF